MINQTTVFSFYTHFVYLMASSQSLCMPIAPAYQSISFIWSASFHGGWRRKQKRWMWKQMKLKRSNERNQSQHFSRCTLPSAARRGMPRLACRKRSESKRKVERMSVLNRHNFVNWKNDNDWRERQNERAKMRQPERKNTCWPNMYLWE